MHPLPLYYPVFWYEVLCAVSEQEVISPIQTRGLVDVGVGSYVSRTRPLFPYSARDTCNPEMGDKNTRAARLFVSVLRLYVHWLIVILEEKAVVWA